MCMERVKHICGAWHGILKKNIFLNQHVLDIDRRSLIVGRDLNCDLVPTRLLGYRTSVSHICSPFLHRESGGNSSLVNRAEKDLNSLFEVYILLYHIW